MAIREITIVGNEVLRKKASEVEEFAKNNESLVLLLDEMAETLTNTGNGIGLAAPQVGVSKRVFIIDLYNMHLEFINPRIISKSKETDLQEEGCLSVPEKRGFVRRPLGVTVQAFDRYGNKFTLTAEKLLARCILHEFDHLEGILYIDKMEKVEENVEENDKTKINFLEK